jgi:hypothetical protein
MEATGMVDEAASAIARSLALLLFLLLLLLSFFFFLFFFFFFCGPYPQFLKEIKYKSPKLEFETRARFGM